MTILIGLGIIAAVLVLLASQRRSVHIDLDDDRDETAPVSADPPPRIAEGSTCSSDQIEDLMWACGYSRDEVRADTGERYIAIFRNGVHAEFSRFRQGVYRCDVFNPHADTSRVDRWSRTPTDSERQQALYR